MATAKKQIGFRLSDHALLILRCGKKQQGIPQTNILEQALRDWARKNKVDTSDPQQCIDTPREYD